jgi:hypothetical protein
MKRDLYAEVSARIVAELERGAAPWIKPWSTTSGANNSAVHEARGSHSDALSALKFARQLGIWFYRTYSKQLDFKPGAFVPPAAPIDATADLKEEIEDR